MTLKAKVISCHGKIHLTSVPKVLPVSESYARYIWHTAGLETRRPLMYPK